MNARSLLLVSLLLSLGINGQALANNDHLKLPSLGTEGAASISLQQEYQLGRTWLRLYRSRVPVHYDPIVQNYLEELIKHLAVYSDLQDYRLELITVRNPTINAFAVPGGVLGVHTGLLLYANDESELAAVLAHELAHLSQHHYARSQEASKASTLPTLAGLLASLVLMATAGGDAGMAAITATQAAAMDRQLRFSRQHEQEADRIGIANLVRAEMDPQGAPRMFESMLKATRFAGQRPPEFLLSHPVTEKRIADARQRANRYPLRYYPPNEDYPFIQARLKLLHRANSKQAVKIARADLASADTPVNRYALSIAYLADNRYQDAQALLEALLEDQPDNIFFHLAAADVEMALQQGDKAVARLEALRRRHPNHYPATMALARALEKSQRYPEAAFQLKRLSRSRPEDPNVWYNLAEVLGLAGDILGVHQARAEFFILNGAYDRASKQLGYGINMAETTANVQMTAMMKERVRQVEILKEQAEKL